MEKSMATSVTNVYPRIVPCIIKNGSEDVITHICYLNTYKQEAITQEYPITPEGLFLNDALEDPILYIPFNEILQTKKNFVVVTPCDGLKHLFEAHNLLKHFRTKEQQRQTPDCPFCRKDLKEFSILLSQKVAENDAPFISFFDQVQKIFSDFGEFFFQIYENHLYILGTSLALLPFIFLGSSLLNGFIFSFYLSCLIVIMDTLRAFDDDRFIDRLLWTYFIGLLLSLVFLAFDFLLAFYQVFLGLNLVLVIQTMQYIILRQGPSYGEVLLDFWGYILHVHE
jgi:hypothetical protein